MPSSICLSLFHVDIVPVNLSEIVAEGVGHALTADEMTKSLLNNIMAGKR